MYAPSMSPSPGPSDEELMLQLAAGRQEALGPLYARYASLIFGLAAQTLDRGTAEEIVQEVFLAVWRKAETFTPERGSFRPWVLQIAHFRIINELRKRGRRPEAAADPDGERLAAVPDTAPEPADAIWHAERRAAVRAALTSLPPAQRDALALAYFGELTHEQIASTMSLPLGTAKTRIRSGLRKLRVSLATLVVGLALVGALVGVGIRYRAEQATRQRGERALALVTSSSTTALHLGPAPGVAAGMHGNFRSQAGAPIIVLTLSSFPPAPPGQTYQAWIHQDGRWIALGTVDPDASGSARLIAEGPELAVPPDAVQVTREPSGGSATPSGTVVVSSTGG